jgi:fucose permease
MEAVAALAFIVFGVALVLPGAVQPALASALGLDLAASGLVASALSLGLGAGVVAGGPLADRLSRRPLFASAAALAALAGLGLALLPSFAGALAATAGIGFGAGVYETLLNAAIPERRPEAAAARLSLLHACATLGAACGAPLLGPFAEAHGFAAAYGALGAAFAVVAALGLAVRFPAPPQARHEAGGAPLSLARLAPWMTGAFAYVGVETALSVFAVPHAESAGHAAARGMRALSGFWLGLFLARVAFAAWRRPARVVHLRLAGAAGALVLGAGAALPLPPEALFVAAGVALGVAFPLLVTFAGEALPPRRATAVGLVVGAGSFGGFVVPWAAGALGDRFGTNAALAGLAALALGIALAARSSRGLETSRGAHPGRVS